MIKREIEIDGRKIPFRASATVPRLYRAWFHRDIFKDLLNLKQSIEKNDGGEESGSSLPIDDLELFENVAFVMAKHADNSQPDTPEEWLDQFDTFSIYNILPKILELWNLNTHQDSESKKKQNQQAGK